MYDLVKPSGNEEKIINRSKLLGTKPILVYEFTKLSDFESKKKEYPNQLIGALIVFETDKSNKLAKELKNKVDLVIGSANFKETAVRRIVSSKHFDVLIDACSHSGKMHTHYQYSNVNQVTAKLAVENEIIYCVNFNNILRSDGTKRSLLMSRIMQNIKIFKKYKVPIAIASFANNPCFLRNSQFFKAMLRLLGCFKISDPIKLRLQEKTERKQENFIKKGVRIIN